MVSSSDRMHGPIPPDPPETDHEFMQSRFTNTTTCGECGLLPLDDEDYYSECNPEEVNNEEDRNQDV